MKTKVEKAPGTYFQYNDYATEFVCLLLKRSTGQRVSDYLYRKIWEPIGMANDAQWTVDSDSKKFERCFDGLNVSPREMARFGQLYLQKGLWNGRQIVPESWVDKSTRTVDSDNPIIKDMNHWGQDHQNYKYYWWSSTDKFYENSYWANGNWGQYIYISEKHNVVVVRTGSGWGEFPERANLSSEEFWHRFMRNLSRVANGKDI